MRPPSRRPYKGPLPPGVRPTFDEVYEGYALYVRLLVQQRVPREDVDDLVQLSLMGIYGALPSYDPTRPLLPWLKTIVHRTARDYLYLERRSTQREPRVARGRRRPALRSLGPRPPACSLAAS